MSSLASKQYEFEYTVIRLQLLRGDCSLKTAKHRLAQLGERTAKEVESEHKVFMYRQLAKRAGRDIKEVEDIDLGEDNE